jgi:hypothetical protein
VLQNKGTTCSGSRGAACILVTPLSKGLTKRKAAASLNQFKMFLLKNVYSSGIESESYIFKVCSKYTVKFLAVLYMYKNLSMC